MAKLLYTATQADGARTEGFVEATSAAAAREQLESRGFADVRLHQEIAVPQDEAELRGLDERQLQELARFKLRLLQSPTLATALGEQLRRGRWWLLLDAALVVYGLWRGEWAWVAAGFAAALVPLALTAWNYRHADRYQRLIRQFAVGNWDAVRVLARALRSISKRRPELDFDLDLRLACIYARDHTLAEALERVEPWRSRWARQPGFFEMRVAAVHAMAGDMAGFVEQMGLAHAASPQDPARQGDHALAQARFGSVDEAERLLATLDEKALPVHGRGFVHWARGLVQLRRAQPGAEATLAQAVTAFLELSRHPAAWTGLALASCDHAIAMHRAGRSDDARALIANVWPVLQAQASVPLLRMLETDGLLPPGARQG